MIVVSGILIVIGGAIFLTNSEAENMMRSVGEGGTLVAIGGKIVSINAARKTPGYRFSEIKPITHSMNNSISFNFFLLNNNEVQYNIHYNILRI